MMAVLIDGSVTASDAVDTAVGVVYTAVGAADGAAAG